MQPIFRTDAKQPPSIDMYQPLPNGKGVIDDSTLKAIELDMLYTAINNCQTIAGKVTLWRSLMNPHTSLSTIEATQRALLELDQNSQVYGQLNQVVAKAGLSESSVYELLYGTFLGMFGSTNNPQEYEGYGYEQYQNGTQCIVDLVQGLLALPTPDSSHLNSLIDQVKTFARSRTYALIKGPAYITEGGVKTGQDKKRWIPALRFRPTLFKPLFLALLSGIALTFYIFPILDWMGISPIVSKLALFVSAPLLLAYIPIVGTFDRDSCIYPLRDEFKKSEELQKLIEVLGQLDQLLSFKTYDEQITSPMILPTLHISAQHSIILKRAKNPVLTKENASYVGNDLDMTNNRLFFITGPNSGGKTAFCKTIAQIQLLAQVGCKVPAELAELSIVDHMFYQAPDFSLLADGEGRFGAELKRTKEIFMTSTDRSLVILDELSEGTTYEERLETSVNILDGFNRKKNITILITHNHQLVDQFINNNIGQAWQVEFHDDGTELSGPTYRLIPGISRVSHADRVAKKIGFSKQDIDKHLGSSN